jgi:hypothetical protein
MTPTTTMMGINGISGVDGGGQGKVSSSWMTYLVVTLLPLSYQQVGNRIDPFANGVAAQARRRWKVLILTFVSPGAYYWSLSNARSKSVLAKRPTFPGRITYGLALHSEAL